jgi:hypothetical protein
VAPKLEFIFVASLCTAMPLSKTQFENVLEKLQSYSSSPFEFIITLLESTDYMDHDVLHDIHQNVDRILNNFARNPSCSPKAIHWAHETMMRTYSEQIRALVQKSTGLHFSAKHATTQKLKEFDILTISEQMKTLAPDLWALLSALLQADLSANTAREVKREQRAAERAPTKKAEDIATGGDESEAEYWKDQEELIEENAEDEVDADEVTRRRETLLTIVR